MPLIMRPPVKNNDDLLDAERLRQVARRKEQNRNAQRRLRERKEEYTMQLEAQLADLHRRSQTQEEESHFLREALARMRAENQTLAEQIAMIHQAVPSTQSSHPLPQRASIDLGVDHFAPLNRSRNRSQSATASMMPHFALPYNAAATAAAPWATSSQQTMTGMHAPFGATIAPGATHRMPFSTASPLPGATSFCCGLTVPQHDSVEDVAMPRSNSVSRTSSISPASQRRDSTVISPFDLRANLSRHGSGQTELTLPGEHSEAETGPATKIRRVSESDRATTASMAGSASPAGDSDAIPSSIMASTLASTAGQGKPEVPNMSVGPDDVMTSCLESIHSLPQANANTTQKTHFDNATSWMSSNHDISGQLSLPDFRNTDMSTMSKPLGMTPGALGLTNAMPGSGVGGDGWTISPWINLAQTPSAGGTTAPDMENSISRSFADNRALETGMAFDNKKSLASRRGFSGSLKLESRVT